jgi:hypothetical protein
MKEEIPEFLQKGRKVLVTVAAEGAEVTAWERDRNGVWEVDKTYLSTRPLDAGQLFVVLKSVGRKHQAYMNVPFDTLGIKPFEEIGAADMSAGRSVSPLKPIAFRLPKP